MSKRLTKEQRSEVIRRAKGGERATALAAEFGVTPRALFYLISHAGDAAVKARSITEVVTFRASRDEILACDVACQRSGKRFRSKALRSLLRASVGFFEPDEEAAALMKDMHRELGRIGSNINQIARRLNEQRIIKQQSALSSPELQLLNQVRETIALQTQALKASQQKASSRLGYVPSTGAGNGT